MKKKLILLLSLVSTSLLAQVKQDTLSTPKDSVKITPFVINDEKPQKKRKKVAEPDTTMSYADEYKRDNVGFQWGVRGGINLGSFTTKEVNVVRVTSSGTPLLENNRIVRDQVLSNKEMVLGYLGSFFIRLTKGSFFLQPELTYTQKGGKFDIIQSNGQLFKRVNTTLSVINVPVLLGIRFRQGRIFAGPMVEFPISFNSALEDAVKTYTIKDFKKDLVKHPYFGVSAGIGFEFHRFFIQGRFETSMGNMIDYEIGPNSNPSKLQISSKALVLSIGLVK
ncbi:porin family protein [Emticicia sp. 17c]|uniref:porin family protein n=1 Tax=Emticicia sp. 17c TaxID=3127704 RepID=UPI00301D0129